MQHDRLITGIAIALAGCALVLTLLGVVYSPAVLFVALAVGAAAYFMWYQASGRLARRVYRSVERQARTNGGEARTGQRTRQTRERGGFGAGPREDWVPPGGRGGQQRARQRRGGQRGGVGDGRERRRAPSTTSGPTEAEAYSVLDLDPGADDDTVKQAYRRKVKEVHPDTDGGDEEQFKRVTRAYERLT